MIHGQGWQFIRLGRYLERAYATATLLEVYQPELFCAPEREHPAINTSSRSDCCAAARHLRPIARCTRPISPPTAFSSSSSSIANFPHAIRYCVDGIMRPIEAIQHTGGRRPPEELTAGIGRLHAMLGYTTIGEIIRRRPGGIPAHHPRAMHAHSRAHLSLLRPLFHSVRFDRLNRHLGQSRPKPGSRMFCF